MYGKERARGLMMIRDGVVTNTRDGLKSFLNIFLEEHIPCSSVPVIF